MKGSRTYRLKKEIYKRRAFDDLVLVLEDRLKGAEILMEN